MIDPKTTPEFDDKAGLEGESDEGAEVYEAPDPKSDPVPEDDQ